MRIYGERSRAGRFFFGADSVSKSFAKAFYNSKAWEETRSAYVAERLLVDGGLCEMCRENVGEELHHIVPLNPTNINDYDICLNPKNLTFLCKDCHFKVHRDLILKQFEEARQRRAAAHILTNGCYMNDEGYWVKAKRFIVWGSPASGKTTYVKKHLEPGDLVVDLDMIKYAISFQSDQPVNLNPIAFYIRDYLYSVIEQGQADCRNVWIIGCFPKRSEREELANRLGAELVHMGADYKTCIERAGADKRSYSYGATIRKALIDKYFENYEP